MRLDAFRVFLAKFDVVSDIDDAGLIMAVSTWMPVYADLLLPDLDDDSVDGACRGFTTSWAGALMGLNPIFDSRGLLCRMSLVPTNEAEMAHRARS
jgi:hypothetical protein